MNLTLAASSIKFAWYSNCREMAIKYGWGFAVGAYDFGLSRLGTKGRRNGRIGIPQSCGLAFSAAPQNTIYSIGPIDVRDTTARGYAVAVQRKAPVVVFIHVGL